MSKSTSSRKSQRGRFSSWVLPVVCVLAFLCLGFGGAFAYRHLGEQRRLEQQRLAEEQREQEEERLCALAVEDVQNLLVRLGNSYAKQQQLVDNAKRISGPFAALGSYTALRKEFAPERERLNKSIMDRIDRLDSKCHPRLRKAWNELYRERGFPDAPLMSGELPTTALTGD